LTTARTADRIVLLAATLVLAGKQYAFPSATFWEAIVTDRPFLLVTLIATVGVFGVITPFETLTRGIRLQRQVVLRGQILTAFGQLLDVTSTVQPPLALNDPGLHIWRRQRTLRHPMGELVRMATYRLGSTPLTRPLRPTQGVGVVGVCWKLNQEVGRDVEDLAAGLTDEQTFRSYRQQHGPDSVMGFSWAEFQRFKHRGAIFASPIRNGRSIFIGCVSFDATHGYNQLNSSRIWHELNSLCLLLGQDGFANV
jgi:hypothetical protein